MNLSELVLKKIKSLGVTKAASYFGVSRQTIDAWKKTKKPPVTAVQKVMDDENPTAGETAEMTESESLPQVTVPAFEDQEAARQRRTNVPQWQVDIETRLTKLENFARAMTDPDRQVSSSVRPAQPIVPAPATPIPSTPPPTPQNGPAPVVPTTTAAPVKGWNTPYPEKRK